jgi:hypothetical protein
MAPWTAIAMSGQEESNLTPWLLQASTPALAELWCVIASGRAYLMPGFTYRVYAHQTVSVLSRSPVTATRARTWDPPITS